MVNLFINILSLSLCSCMILLPVFFTKKIFLKKYGVSWRFLTCLLLSVRLLLPFSFGETSLFRLVSEADFSSDSPGQLQPVFISDNGGQEGTAKDKISSGMKKEEKNHNESLAHHGFYGMTDQEKVFRALQIGMVIWIAGMCMYFIHLALSWLAFRKKLKRWCAVPEPAALKIFSELCEEMHIKRKIRLVQCGTVYSPMLAGLFHTWVILPQDRYQENEYRLLLQHELCHYVHGDLLWKHLLALVGGIYWFVPWIHHMAGLVNGDMEMLCDKAVIRRNGESCKKAYSMVLLRHITMQQTQVSSLTTYFNGGKEQMKERFRQLMNNETSKKGAGLVFGFALLIGITGGAAFALADGVRVDTWNNTKADIPMGQNTAVASHGPEKGIKKTKEEGATDKSAAATVYDSKEDDKVSDTYYDVMVYRLKPGDAPEKIQEWVESCNSSIGIYIKKYDKRYWIYTNAIGAGNDCEFASTVRGNNSIAKITVKPYKDAAGDGYVLLSAPKYKKLTARCGKYLAESGK